MKTTLLSLLFIASLTAFAQDQPADHIQVGDTLFTASGSALNGYFNHVLVKVGRTQLTPQYSGHAFVVSQVKNDPHRLSPVLVAKHSKFKYMSVLINSRQAIDSGEIVMRE